jgi:hypothetical protein
LIIVAVLLEPWRFAVLTGIPIASLGRGFLKERRCRLTLIAFIAL